MPDELADEMADEMANPYAAPTGQPLILAVLGAGVMGGAVLSALLDAGIEAPAETGSDAEAEAAETGSATGVGNVRVEPGNVRVTTLDPDAAARWKDRGVTVTTNEEAVAGANVVLVATKPADVPAVLDEASAALAPDALVISLAAGVPLATLEAHVPAATAVIRVMPNTPALVGEGMSALSPGAACSPAQAQTARALLSACGAVVTVPEKQQNAVTALSGSGPAYLFYVLEAMIDAGVLLGLPRPVATELAVQTAYGAATMVRRGGEHPGRLREQVTSPGGTTAAALRTLDTRGVRAAMMEAIEAAARRSAELA